MAETFEQNKVYDDEIDVLEIFNILKNNKTIIALSVAFFIALGFFYIVFAKPVYKYTVPVKLPYSYSKAGSAIDSKSVDIFISSFMNDLKTNIVRTSNKYKIPVALLEEIRNVSFADEKKNGQIFYLAIMAYSPNAISNIQDALITALNNIEDINDLEKHDEELIDFEIQKNTEFIKDLNVKYGDIANLIESDVFKTYGTTPVQVYNQILGIEKRILSLKQTKTKLNGFNPIEKGLIPEKPYEPKKMLIMAAALFTGLFLGICVVLLKELKQTSRA